MRIDLLGAVEVWPDAEPVRLPRGRVQIVLITLALAGGRPVSINALVERVWGEHPPRNPVASLATLMHRLRDIVGNAAVQNTPSGYALRIEPERVDVLRFRRLIADSELIDDDAKSHSMLDEAIGLWRGDPLAGIDAFERDEIPHLIEEYLNAHERRSGLDLAAGRYEAVIVTLHELTARYPLRETLWYQFIAALAGTGRQADALTTYEAVRHRLADELGVDPSDALQELHGQVLRGELPVLRRTHGHLADELPSDRGASAAPNTLPADIADFAGRHDELAAIIDASQLAADTVTIAAIDGMGGVGKTMIAIRAAHQLAAECPDAQLFLDLHGHTPGYEPVQPAEALGSLLRAIGASSGALPEPVEALAGLWRSTLAGRRVLIVLDNAASAEQVRALLPGTAGCIVLITSRRRLVDLDTTVTISVAEFDDGAACSLFASVVGRGRTDPEPTAVTDVLAMCGNLPLAIRIAAARLRARPAWRVAHLADRLRGAGDRLAELAAGDRGVASTLAVSYQHLTPAGRRMFRLLGLVPGTSFDAYAAAALADVTVSAAEFVLADLVDAHLISEMAPGRFQLHDLVRAQAHLTVTTDESTTSRDDAELRLLDYYLALSGRSHATLLAMPMRPWIKSLIARTDLPPAAGYHALLEVLLTDRINLMSAIDRAADEARDHHAMWLPYLLGYFLDLCGYTTDAERVHGVALQAAERLGDDIMQATLMGNLAPIRYQARRFAAALESADRAGTMFDRLGDIRGVARSLNNAGNALYRLGRYPDALDRYQRAFALTRDQSAERGAFATNLSIIELRLGRLDSAREYSEQALTADQTSDPYRVTALNVFGNVLRHAGDVGAAERAYTDAAQLSLERGDHAMRASISNNLGILDRMAGNYATAVGRHTRALRLIHQTQDQNAEAEINNDLGLTLAAAGHPQLAAATHRAALEAAHASGEKYELARAHEGLANSTQATDPATALDHAKEALALLVELGVPDAGRVKSLIAALPG